MTEEKEKVCRKSTTKSKDKSNKREKIKPLTKVVVRRLPPTMTEEDFIKQVDPLPDHEYYYYVHADWSLGHDATCRAYINFSNPDDIFLFKDRFDGYVFVDNKGSEYPAIVEFAPFQGLPRNKSRKKDPKCNTIESDPHYINFLETLKNDENEGGKNEVKLEFSYQIKDDKKITSTPLLQYLANKKQERRDERKRKLDEKRRQREEERSRKKTQIAKNIPPPIKEEDRKDNPKDDERSENQKERDKHDDGKKDLRSKRRDRDFKRKQERDRQIQDRKNQENSNKDHASDNKNQDREKDTATGGETKRKEVKKYSSRRSRNEKRSELASSSSTLFKDNIESAEKKEKDTKDTNKTDKDENKEEVSESVKEFIKSIANIKEFVPRSRTILLNTDVENFIKQPKDGKEVNMCEVRDKLEKISCADYDSNNKVDESMTKSEAGNNSPECGARDSSCSGADKNDRGRDERTGRRIRNKDRPSIEIYQPGKLRQKKDDGRSSAELRDYKSNPTSDCESIKKEKEDKPVVRKKVSRYSERRSSRVKEKSANDEKISEDFPETSNPAVDLDTNKMDKAEEAEDMPPKEEIAVEEKIAIDSPDNND